MRAIGPLAEQARLKIRAVIAAASAPFGDETTNLSVVGSLEADLMHRLDQAASKVLVLELGVAAERDLLVGDAPKDRFDFFCDCLGDRAFAAQLLLRYPVLLRRLTRIIAHWRDATQEMIERLGCDWSLIGSEVLSDRAVGALTSVTSLGDAHAGGRAVHRLGFASGAALIYKPRSVAMEANIFNFIAWANAHGLAPDLMVPRTIDRGTYGWVQNLEPLPCSNSDAVKRFFRRQGANLALTYMLGATDLHFENVLAVGEYPVVVDWETLFHAPPMHGGRGASAAALKLIFDSSVRTLMLPLRSYGDDPDGTGRRSADISALGYADAQDAPFPSLGWAEFGTDAMRQHRFYGVLPPGQSLPLLDGGRVPARTHQDEIEAGFNSAYRFFQRRKRTLLSQNGPLRAFKNQVVRHVFRPTARYTQLLAESWHPRLAKDASQLSAYLRNQLDALEVLESGRAALTSSEIKSLIDGDVPYFVARVGARLVTTPAQPKLGIRLSSDGWQATLDRIRLLDDQDRARQIWIARVAFANSHAPLPPNFVPPRKANRQRLIERAAAIGDHLCDIAVVRGDRASWLFPMTDQDGQLSPSCVGFSMYHGLSGIALFLGRLSSSTRRRRFSGMMDAAIAEALALHKGQSKSGLSIGAYDGSAGLAYALARLGRWHNRPDWLAKARALMRAEIKFARSEAGLDLISGSGGLLLGATAVAEIADDHDLVIAAKPIASVLLDVPAEALPKDHDCGLAHGKAGIGYALARWAKAAGDTPALATAKKWLNDDLRAAKSARLRAQHEDGAAMLAWCRGSLGTAWAMMALGLTSEPAADVVRALAAEVRVAGTGPLCPCHGILGAVDFLLDARAAGVDGAPELLRTLRGEALGRVFSGETCADHSHRIETPGLLVGLAGSGYTLLRLADPKITPSVLMM